MNALILEDDLLTAKNIEQNIKQNTQVNDVHICLDLDSALLALEQKHFHICFIDIEIGKSLSGFDLARTIRNKQKSGIVYITGHSDDETINKMTATFPDGYILKPFNDRQLVAVTKQVLNKHCMASGFGQVRLKYEDGILTDSKIELFQSIINSIYLISLTDAKGNILFANDAFSSLSGYAPSELVGKNHSIVNSGKHPKSYIAHMWQTILDGRIWQGEFCNRKKDGEIYWVHSSIFPLRDDQDQIYFMSIRTDITPNKLLQKDYQALLETKAQELMESQYFVAELLKTEQINHFAATLSHEVKKPLSSITMQLQVITRQHPDLENKILEKLNRLELSTKKTIELANYINKIFRKNDNSTKEINLTSFVREIIDFSNMIFCYDNVEFLYDFPEEFLINSSEEILFISIFNLLKNAVEAFDENSPHKIIKTSIEKNDQFCEISVSDNAGGIAKHIAEELFNSKVTTTKPDGSGLGLAITRMILKAIKAEIELACNNEYGACFKIKIPIQNQK
jgi:PAS domain S-box-containing protein